MEQMIASQESGFEATIAMASTIIHKVTVINNEINDDDVELSVGLTKSSITFKILSGLSISQSAILKGNGSVFTVGVF